MTIELTDNDIRKILADKFDCNTDDIIFDTDNEYDEYDGWKEIVRVVAKIEKE